MQWYVGPYLEAVWCMRGQGWFVVFVACSLFLFLFLFGSSPTLPLLALPLMPTSAPLPSSRGF